MSSFLDLSSSLRLSKEKVEKQERDLKMLPVIRNGQVHCKKSHESSRTIDPTEESMFCDTSNKRETNEACPHLEEYYCKTILH